MRFTQQFAASNRPDSANYTLLERAHKRGDTLNCVITQAGNNIPCSTPNFII